MEKQHKEIFLNIFKKCVRIPNQEIQLTSVKNMFFLLEHLVHIKDEETAPQLYKILIFALIENHSEKT